jgi:hypothetical protein
MPRNSVSSSNDQLGRSYSDVKVEFKTLEDLDTIVNVAGANMPMARYAITASFSAQRACRRLPCSDPELKEMNDGKLTKDEVQKMGLSALGFVRCSTLLFVFPRAAQ